MHIITVRPNAKAMAIQSPNPPKGPIAAAPGVTVFEINNVTTAEPVPKNTRKNVPKIYE